MKCYDAKAIARVLDLTDRRVRQLRDEKIIDEVRPGLYDLTPTIHKYINYIRQGNPESETRIDYQTERAKLVRAKRLNEEYDLSVKESRLHSSEDIERVMSSMLINFKTRLMAIPAKLSPILSKKTSKADIFQLLKINIDEALNELADFDTVYDCIEGVAEDEEINKSTV